MLKNDALNVDLSPRVHSLVSLGLLIVFIFSIWGLLVKPLIHLSSQALGQLYDARFELARAKLLSDELTKISRQEIDQEDAELIPLLLRVDTTTGKESAMQEIVDQIIHATRFNLESMRVSSTTQQGSINRVSIDIKGSGEEASIIEMMAAIERHKPVLVIDQLNLRTASKVTQPDQIDAVSALEAELRLSGFSGDLTSLEVPQP